MKVGGDCDDGHSQYDGDIYIMMKCMSRFCLFCWENYFGRWENYFGGFENYFGRWENYFGGWENWSEFLNTGM